MNHVTTFLTVYSHRNISHAAEELQMSQSSVTGHIKALERQLGRPLFIRLHRGVDPTPVAHSLAQELTEPLSLIHESVSRHHAQNDVGDAHLTLAGPPDLLSHYALPALASLVQAGLRLTIAPDDSPRLLDSVADGTVDIAISPTVRSHAGVRATPAFEEHFALVAAPSLAQDMRAMTPGGYDRAPLIAYGLNLPLVRRYWRSEFPGAPLPQAHVVMPDLRGIVRAVAAGMGWSVVPTYLAEASLADGSIVQAHTPMSAPTNTLYVCTSAGRERSPAVTEVTAALQRGGSAGTTA